MPIVSIDGTGGTGKSFLASQLAALLRCPLIPEGEVGVYPDWVVASFNNPDKSTERSEWFTRRCCIAMQTAKQISDAGHLCIVDSGPLTHEAYLARDNNALGDTNPNMKRDSAKLRSIKPDLSIVLTANESYLRRMIQQRARNFELTEAALNRFIVVHQYIIVLEPLYSCFRIDRSFGHDFSKPQGLKHAVQVLENHLGLQLTEYQREQIS